MDHSHFGFTGCILSSRTDRVAVPFRRASLTTDNRIVQVSIRRSIHLDGICSRHCQRKTQLGRSTKIIRIRGCILIVRWGSCSGQTGRGPWVWPVAQPNQADSRPIWHRKFTAEPPVYDNLSRWERTPDPVGHDRGSSFSSACRSSRVPDK